MTLNAQCPATKDGHRYVEGHSLGTRWELLLFCERCGQTVKVDATAWTNIQRDAKRRTNDAA